MFTSVAVPEPVEPKLFAGAGAEIFGPAPALGMQIHFKKCYKTP
jgi:hypothetical protein